MLPQLLTKCMYHDFFVCLSTYPYKKNFPKMLVFQLVTSCPLSLPSRRSGCPWLRPFKLLPALRRTVTHWCNRNFNLVHFFQLISTSLLSCEWLKLNTAIWFNLIGLKKCRMSKFPLRQLVTVRWNKESTSGMYPQYSIVKDSNADLTVGNWEYK